MGRAVDLPEFEIGKLRHRTVAERLNEESRANRGRDGGAAGVEANVRQIERAVHDAVDSQPRFVPDDDHGQVIRGSRFGSQITVERIGFQQRLLLPQSFSGDEDAAIRDNPDPGGPVRARAEIEPIVEGLLAGVVWVGESGAGEEVGQDRFRAEERHRVGHGLFQGAVVRPEVAGEAQGDVAPKRERGGSPFPRGRCLALGGGFGFGGRF